MESHHFEISHIYVQNHMNNEGDIDPNMCYTPRSKLIMVSQDPTANVQLILTPTCVTHQAAAISANRIGIFIGLLDLCDVRKGRESIKRNA